MSDEAYTVTADELRQFVEQFEQLELEKKKPTELQKELMTEAKSRGYDTKVIRRIIRLRKLSRDEIQEEEELLNVYMTALGMV